MGSRLELQRILEELLGTSNLPQEKRRVYFQPPATVKLEYPCIIYSLSRTDVSPADNKKYVKYNEYEVLHIFKSLSNEKKDLILDAFYHIDHDRRYIVDSLYHDVFTLYY